MFAVIPIRSGLPYDPWADIDDSGKIDMKDIGNVASRFMASGDPTKPVTLANYTQVEGNFGFSLGTSQYVNSSQNFNISTAGYRDITIKIKAFSMDVHSFQVLIDFISVGADDPTVQIISSNSPIYAFPGPPGSPSWYPRWEVNFKQTYEITSSQVMIWVWNNSTSNSLGGTLNYYLST
jgi:hypothetical protein